MAQSIRSLLLSVAVASFLANGVQGLINTGAASGNTGSLPASVDYVRDGDMVTGLNFQLPANSGTVSVKLSANDSWHSCSRAGTQVRCSIDPRPVTDVNRLELKTV